MKKIFEPKVLKNIWSIRRNTNLLVEICQSFHETQEAGLTAFNLASGNQDLDELSYWIHQMKGSTLNVGAVDLAQCLVERRAKLQSVEKSQTPKIHPSIVVEGLEDRYLQSQVCLRQKIDEIKKST